MKKLLIVESPNKAKTIKQYLSSLPDTWRVIASYGHFKNLKKETLSVEKSNNSYVGNFVIENQSAYKILKENIQWSEMVFVATDDDREGEAIAFDIIDAFFLKIENYRRVVFTEISKKFILDILSDSSKTKQLDIDMVNSRYARRLIDRLIGYKLSPLLKYEFRDRSDLKIEGIGRVSYASLSLIVDKEKEINSFTHYKYRRFYVAYWTDTKEFTCASKTRYIEGIEDDEFYSALNTLNNSPHIITDYSTEYVDLNPPKPIISSSLLSNIFYLYSIPTNETSEIAQKLFEGIELYGEIYGLITYTRTDSYRINDEFAQEIIDMIPYIVLNREDGPIGYEYGITEMREYKNKKGAQDAHEAIRPTNLDLKFSPASIRKYLSQNEFKVYDYIYKITLASFMAPSSYISTNIQTTCGDIIFESETKEQVFDGWEILAKNYVPHLKKYERFEKNPPILSINDELTPRDIGHSSREAKQPDRFSEGRLVDMLFNSGVGRPSTLPGIIPELMRKEYITSYKGMIKATETAMVLVKWARENASWVVNMDHARVFEENLEKIENGTLKRDELIGEYDELLIELYKELDFVSMEDYKNIKPSEGQIKLLNSMEEKGLDISDEVYQSKLKATKAIKKFMKAKEVCPCKICDNGKILHNEKSYSCNNKKCNFVLWISKIERFIENFQLEYTMEELALSLLKKKQMRVENMQGKNSIFKADVFIENDTKFGYTIKMNIVRGRKS